MEWMTMSKRAVPLGVFFVATTILGCSDDPFVPEPDPNALEHITPEEAGFSPAALQQAVDGFEEIGSAAVVALYDGKVLLLWGEVNRKFSCHSIRKPFLSALYGVYVGAGMIDTTKTLAQLGIDDIPPSLSDEEKQARVADLLKSRSGVYHEAAAEVPQMVAERPDRFSHPPNAFFYYNNWDFNVAGAIFEQETGMGIFEAFEQDIAGPIGMEDWSASDGSYYLENEKSMHPAYPFRMTAMDMARFGLLYLRNGNWQGEQIVPSDWVAASTKPYSIIDPNMHETGYGMMWATIPENDPLGSGGGFYHTGIGVHMLIVLPQKNLVIVHRVNTDESWTMTDDDYFPLIQAIMNARIE
jgi:CubicO group peptidase (beta-lactamase class C family)